MTDNEKEGYYCSICGGIPPDRIKVKRVLIDGKETGIDQLDFIFESVKKMHLSNVSVISEEIMKRVKEFNYVPTKKESIYAEALLKEYNQWVKEHA